MLITLFKISFYTPKKQSLWSVCLNNFFLFFMFQARNYKHDNQNVIEIFIFILFNVNYFVGLSGADD